MSVLKSQIKYQNVMLNKWKKVVHFFKMMFHYHLVASSQEGLPLLDFQLSHGFMMNLAKMILVQQFLSLWSTNSFSLQLFPHCFYYCISPPDFILKYHFTCFLCFPFFFVSYIFVCKIWPIFWTCKFLGLQVFFWIFLFKVCASAPHIRVEYTKHLITWWEKYEGVKERGDAMLILLT